MNFNVFSIPTFLSALIVAVTGVVVFKNDPKSSVNRALSYFCASVFGWLFTYSTAYCSSSSELAYAWVKIGFASVSFIPFTNAGLTGAQEEAQGVLPYVTEADDAGNAAAVRYRRIGDLCSQLTDGAIYGLPRGQKGSL